MPCVNCSHIFEGDRPVKLGVSYSRHDTFESFKAGSYSRHDTLESFKAGVEGPCCVICLVLERGLDSADVPPPESPLDAHIQFETWENSVFEFDSLLIDFHFDTGHAFDIKRSIKLSSIEKDFDATPSASAASSFTSSEECLDQAFDWLSKCNDGHACLDVMHSNGCKYLPTRLIDVRPNNQSEWRLFVPGPAFKPNIPYMTLSHRWEKNPFLTLTKTTYTSLCAGLPLSSLPKTFRDAVIVTRRFGIRFLWIDSLCIFQDSMEDWLAEAEQMEEVYSNSFCSIAADWSGASDRGCFSRRDPRRVDIPKINLGWKDNREYLVVSPDLWRDCIALAPLNRRAWVFQERLLAPRILHFGKEQLFWECNKKVACETYPTGIPYYIEYDSLKQRYTKLRTEAEEGRVPRLSSAQKLWYDIVEAYSRCSATKPVDKLIALSGVARQLAQMMQDRYVVGLWEKNLAHQLLWKIDLGFPTSHSPIYRAPSWSWAAIDGKVDFSSIRRNRSARSILIEVGGIDLSPSSGLLENAVIKLKGSLIPVKECNSDDNLLVAEVKIGNQLRLATLYLDVQSSGLRGSLYYLPIVADQYFSGLGLEKVDTDDELDRYQRVCLLALFFPTSEQDTMERALKSLPQKTIELV